jgi:hypothetical protein
MRNKSTSNLFYQWFTEPSCIDIRNNKNFNIDSRTFTGGVSPHCSLCIS